MGNKENEALLLGARLGAVAELIDKYGESEILRNVHTKIRDELLEVVRWKAKP